MRLTRCPAERTLTIATGCGGGWKSAGAARCHRDQLPGRGEGIPKQNFDKIFLPFFTTKKRLGVGVGPGAPDCGSATTVDQGGRAKSGAAALSCVFRSLGKPGLGYGMKEGNRGKILVVDDEQGCAMC